jgi:outer membrane usher protein
MHGSIAHYPVESDEQALPPVNRNAIAQAVSGECTRPSDISEDITWSFNLNDLRLDIGVAQALLRRTPRGSVSPELLDDGVPSATVAYNFNTFHTTGSSSVTSTYLGIDSGLNIGAWHLRQRSSMSWQSMGQSTYDYQNIATYLQRDISRLRSQLTLGDAYTDGAVFDSFSVRGVNLASDDRMLPDSARGYAPLVRGVARSNARVTVTQNGNKLYETTVAPGPFEIKDLYATGYGGNLLVTVTEADGSQSSFTVPYASVAQLLRPGITRYSATVGEYRDGSRTSSRREKLVQGTVQHGFNNFVTGYAGLVLSEGYQAGMIGAALNLPIGAFALDATHAHASIDQVDNTSGQSVRLSYSKFVPSTSTSMSLAAYRYATRGFWTMSDAFTARASGGNARAVDRQRSQIQLTLNQSLGDRWGNFYLTGTSAEYWNRGGTALMFQVGYSNSLRVLGLPMTYNIAASRQREAMTGRFTTQVFASLTVPLGKSIHAPMLSFGATHNSDILATDAAERHRTRGQRLHLWPERRPFAEHNHRRRQRTVPDALHHGFRFCQRRRRLHAILGWPARRPGRPPRRHHTRQLPWRHHRHRRSKGRYGRARRQCDGRQDRRIRLRHCAVPPALQHEHDRDRSTRDTAGCIAGRDQRPGSAARERSGKNQVRRAQRTRRHHLSQPARWSAVALRRISAG